MPTPITPPLPTYPSLHTRATPAGALPRDYLLEYVVWSHHEYLQVLAAGPCCFAVVVKADYVRRFDLTKADLAAIPGVRVITCLPHAATLFVPLARSEREVIDEVACAFVAYEAKGYDITSELERYEMEMGYEIQADYHLDEAA